MAVFLIHPPTLSIIAQERVCMNVIVVLSGECKQTGSRRGGKDRPGVREHTDTPRVLRKSKVGGKRQ